MAQNTDWKYFLIDKDGKTYRKENGVVVSKNDIKPLKFTPSGWQDISIAWERDLTVFGLIRNFSLPLGFVLDGGEILRELLYDFNYEKAVFLLIQKQKLVITPTQYYFVYDYFYKGQLNLTTLLDEEDKVTCAIGNTKLQLDYKANEKTTYEIPVDEIFIYMDGLTLKETGNFGVVDGLEIAKSIYGTNFFLPIFYKNSDGQSTGFGFQTTSVTSVGGSGFDTKIADIVNAFAIANKYLSDVPVTVTISGSLSYKVTQNDIPFGINMRILTSDLTGVTQDAYRLNFTGPITAGSVRTCNFTFDIPATTSTKFHIEGIFTGGPNGAIDVSINFLPNSVFTFSFHNRKAPSYIKAVFAKTLFNRLCQRISPGCVTQSKYLDNLTNLTVTSFDAIRGLQGAVIKTSLADFFTSVNAVGNLATGIYSVDTGTIYGVQEAIVIEKKDIFFNEASKIQLGIVKMPKTTVFKDVLANTIKIGYPVQEVNAVTDINGRQEFNTTAVYITPGKQVVKELNLVSVYRADAFGIENGRLNLDGKTNTSDNADNDVCFLVIDSSQTYSDINNRAFYRLLRKTYDTITGLLYPNDVFNIELLTPKRMMMNHASWLNSIFTGFEGQLIKFSTISKNRELYTQLGAEIYEEDADYIISSTPRLFKPFLFEVTPETPANLVEQLEANINSCFTFIHPLNGVTYTGFLNKVGIAANTEQEQQYLLICAPSVDLKTLII